MKRDTQEIAIFNLEYFLRFENFPGRAYRVTANFSVIIIIRWMFHQWCSVSPFFPRRFVPSRLPGSGSAETHFPSEEKRKNDATSIDQNRMTPRKKSSPDGNGTRGKCFFFFPSLSLSPPMCHQLATFRRAAFLLVVRVKWFFGGLVPVAIFSRRLPSPIERNSWNRITDKGVWYTGRNVNIKYSIPKVIYRTALPLKLLQSSFLFFLNLSIFILVLDRMKFLFVHQEDTFSPSSSNHLKNQSSIHFFKYHHLFNFPLHTKQLYSLVQLYLLFVSFPAKTPLPPHPSLTRTLHLPWQFQRDASNLRWTSRNFDEVSSIQARCSNQFRSIVYLRQGAPLQLD